MAINVNGNTIHANGGTTGSVGLSSPKGVTVSSVIVTPTSASARLQLSDDDGTPTPKMDLRWSNNEETKQYLFEKEPIIFPNGVNISNLTNVEATIVYKSGGAS